MSVAQVSSPVALTSVVILALLALSTRSLCRSAVKDEHLASAFRPAGTTGTTQRVPPAVVSRDAQAMLEAVNEARAAHGEPAVALDARLTAAAERHAHDLSRSGTLTHDGADGSNVGKRADRAGYDWSRIAENLASVPDVENAQHVVQRWMDSRPHQSNLLNDAYVHIGVGHDQRIWVLVLGKPR